jgi:hypothetical protein
MAAEVLADFLIDLVARFGRPTYPITVRNSAIGCEPGALAAEASTAPTTRKGCSK